MLLRPEGEANPREDGKALRPVYYNGNTLAKERCNA